MSMCAKQAPVTLVSHRPGVTFPQRSAKRMVTMLAIYLAMLPMAPGLHLLFANALPPATFPKWNGLAIASPKHPWERANQSNLSRKYQTRIDCSKLAETPPAQLTKLELLRRAQHGRATDTKLCVDELANSHLYQCNRPNRRASTSSHWLGWQGASVNGLNDCAMIEASALLVQHSTTNFLHLLASLEVWCKDL